MKRILIISPYFPPVNTADTHRVRLSLPFFEQFGWIPEVVTVCSELADLGKDDELLKTVPKQVKIHHIGALQKKWTSKLGFGNIGYRSLINYARFLNKHLKKGQFDLIYFSTTQFPVCVLGAYCKWRFNIPYVIDVQDMWHSEYYAGKSAASRPPKYWLSHYINKWMERVAMKGVSGLISVSGEYIKILKSRYSNVREIPVSVITFPAANIDYEYIHGKGYEPAFPVESDCRNIVYIGRGGKDLQPALEILFSALRNVLADCPQAQKLRFFFIGTSYAPAGTGLKTVAPVAEKYNVGHFVHEQTDRVGYFKTLYSLQAADVLLIPGSDDPNYTASKIFPYILAARPLFAILSKTSSAFRILAECTNATLIALDEDKDMCMRVAEDVLKNIALERHQPARVNKELFSQYSAEALTKEQALLFDQVIKIDE